MERISRRAFVAGMAAGGLGVAGLTAFGAYDAHARQPFVPRLERLALRVPAGHEGLAGLRIGFVADTHLGPTMGEGDVGRALELIAAERPDLVLFGGDYISASPRYAAPAAALLGGLAAGAPLGGYAVLGNHDCGERFRDQVVTEALTAAGLTVLRNAAAAVETGGGYDVVRTRIAGTPLTEFALYNAAGEARFYPRTVSVGEPAEVQISITNRENREVTYRIAVAGAGVAVDLLPEITLADDESWQGPVRFTVSSAGEDLPVRFELVRTDRPAGDTPYRLLQLIVDGVAPPGA